MVNQLLQALCALPEVEALALGGSRAGENFDAASDYDVYLYCTGPVPLETRRELLSGCCDLLELGSQFWEYEDNCRLNNGIDLDLLYRDLDAFSAEIAQVVEEFQARNGYTTCLWHNLRTCKILYDRDGRLARAKQRFNVPYPPQLRESIVRRSWKLLHAALPAYDRQLVKAAARGDWVSVNHRTAAFLESYFDLLFAWNRQTHPGEKRLISLCRETCPILPKNFEEHLTALFQDLFARPERIPGDLEKIVQALEKVITAPA